MQVWRLGQGSLFVLSQEEALLPDEARWSRERLFESANYLSANVSFLHLTFCANVSHERRRHAVPFSGLSN